MDELSDTTIDSSRSSLSYFDWKELWGYRELFYFFTWRDIKIKYKQTLLGFLWVIIQPLLLMVIFTFFFGKALGATTTLIPYPIYVFSGLLMWNIFSSGLANGALSMVNNSLIIKKIYFPRIIIPTSSILVALVDFFVALFIFLPLLVIYAHPVSWSALFAWPLAIALCVLATMGPSCWLSALNLKYRDFRYVIPFLIQILFFLTPVIYPVSFLNYPALQYVVIFSPMYAVLELFRYPLGGTMPEMAYLATSGASTLFFLIIGILYFKRTENYFADFA